jgi:hypothetical protein
MVGLMSRRSFLLRGLSSVAGGLAAVSVRGVSAVKGSRKEPQGRQPVFFLFVCGSCRACNACRNHSANKVFRTREAADSTRAHPNCDCLITGGSISKATHIKYFGLPPVRDVVDLRHV